MGRHHGSPRAGVITGSASSARRRSRARWSRASTAAVFNPRRSASSRAVQPSAYLRISRSASPRRQAEQSPLDQAPLLVVEQPAQWRGRRICCPRDLPVGIPPDERAVPARLAPVDQRLPDSQAIEPPDKPPGLEQGRSLRDGRQRHLLHHLVHGLPLLHTGRHHAAQPAVVLPEDRGPVEDRRSGRRLPLGSSRGPRLWCVHDSSV